MQKHYAVALAIMAIVVVFFAVTLAKQVSFQAQLSGQAVVPRVATVAKGDVKFQLNRPGDELSYTLTVRNIENVTHAYLHVGSRADSLGRRVVTLYGGPALPGPTNGILADGIIKSSNLKGPLMDQPLSELLKLFAEGLAFVDVRTEQMPSGEIRGQVE